MKSAVPGLASSLIFCLAPCLLAQQASLSGLAIDAITQMPLAGVHVSLLSLAPETDAAYGAISNATGHYSIGKIQPGTYRLNLQRVGYVYVSDQDAASAPLVTLKPGEQNADCKIAMAPEATVTGRVLDEFGDPVQGASVRVISADDIAPYGLWTMRDETDDRGQFRISGLPGKYYVEASVPVLQTSGPAEIRTDGSSTTPYATTYYSGALAKERGIPVDATAGKELTGIDIHVAHRKSLKIGGTVTGIPAGGPPAIVTIRLDFDGREAEDTANTAADGSFVFADLPPGEYRLSAAEGETLRSPDARVTIETDDAAVNLAVSAGEELRGMLEFEGAAPATPTVRLIPDAGERSPGKSGQVAPDGSFTIDGIIPGIYRVSVDPLPENAYIRSVALGTAESSLDHLDLSRGVSGNTVKVSVSVNGGQISGSIADQGGQSLFGRLLVVFLAGEADSFAAWRKVPTSDSTFTIHGIPPGKYKLFAVDPGAFGGLRTYESVKAVAAAAQEIEIKDGDRITRDLRLSGKDDAGAKP